MLSSSDTESNIALQIKKSFKLYIPWLPITLPHSSFNCNMLATFWNLIHKVVYCLSCGC